MKRLFCIKHNNPKAVKSAGIDCYFTNKTGAKKARDSVGGFKSGFYVALGPDHHAFGYAGYLKTHFGTKDAKTTNIKRR